MHPLAAIAIWAPISDCSGQLYAAGVQEVSGGCTADARGPVGGFLSRFESARDRPRRPFWMPKSEKLFEVEQFLLVW